MEEEVFFYCQACDAKITMDQLALLNEGKCPTCGTVAGFSSLPKAENEKFEHLTTINDTQMMKRVLDQ
jgi:transcription initiation factor IIE alpha subunit